MRHYPDHSIILENAKIVRQRKLPEGIRGEVLFGMGAQVAPNDVVAWATRSSDYVIIDVAGAVGLDPDRDSEKLSQILESLKIGDHLKQGDVVGESKIRHIKRRLPKAPANAIISLVEQGRVILQVNPETVEVRARLAGEVVAVEEGAGVTIQAYGTLLQGAWGNGRFMVGRFEFEPETVTEATGMQEILKLDLSLSPYTNKMIILTRAVTEEDLLIVDLHELGGLVAPTAPYYLRERIADLAVPVILTEGFGNLPPTTRIYDLLLERRTMQGIFDASVANYRTGTRPEILLLGGVAPSEALSPVLDAPLSLGMMVRVQRAPYRGRIGLVTGLPESPIRLENGLRVPVAQVKLTSGENITVPQVNLESLGVAAEKAQRG